MQRNKHWCPILDNNLESDSNNPVQFTSQVLINLLTNRDAVNRIVCRLVPSCTECRAYMNDNDASCTDGFVDHLLEHGIGVVLELGQVLLNVVELEDGP